MRNDSQELTFQNICDCLSNSIEEFERDTDVRVELSRSDFDCFVTFLSLRIIRFVNERKLS